MAQSLLVTVLISIGSALAVFAILWVRFWVNKAFDNRYEIDRMLGITWHDSPKAKLVIRNIKIAALVLFLLFVLWVIVSSLLQNPWDVPPPGR